MSKETVRLNTLLQAVEYVSATLAKYPERQYVPIGEASRKGVRRLYSGLRLDYLRVPGDDGDAADAIDLPTVETLPGPDGELARQVAAVLEPLRMLNPVTPAFGLGRGTGTLVPSFGIPLDPASGDAPAHTLTLEEALARPAPDPATSGLMPEIRDRIAFIQSRIPAGKGYYIAMPNMQGLFNLAHAILGEDAMIGPLVKPDLYGEFMIRLADFWIGAWRQLHAWIGSEWMTPDRRGIVHLGFCSVNLVSTDFYIEHILPYDLRLVRELDFPLSIHPCSGPHVFRATLEKLPNVMATEAGFIEKTAAGAVSVDEALKMIHGRPITLHIGQELPPGDEFDFIRRDFDRYAEHPRLSFNYTGMHWRSRDRARIQDIHRRLDDYWRTRYGGEIHYSAEK